MLRPAALLLFWMALAGSVGCAGSMAGRGRNHGPHDRPAPPQAEVPGPLADASGTWDWVLRSTNEQGDVRIEQEEWHLSQTGIRLSGYYDRMVTLLSSDQRPFQCNGALGYTKNSRIRITGEVRGGQVSVQEVAADTQPGPCDSGARNLMSYSGVLRGDSLMLRFAPGGSQFLTRRTTGPAAGGGLSGTPGGSAAMEAARQQAARVPIDGIWDWELSTVDAEGDLRTEREEWHLSESDSGIAGFYERTVLRTRPGGTFGCNGEPVMRTLTRYSVKGQRFGDRLTVSEIDFKAQPGPCDNGQRRLDTYQGAISPGGQELLLSWGPGNQLLRRRR